MNVYPYSTLIKSTRCTLYSVPTFHLIPLIEFTKSIQVTPLAQSPSLYIPYPGRVLISMPPKKNQKKGKKGGDDDDEFWSVLQGVRH